MKMTATSTASKSNGGESRRVSKPLMEKRRRARINHSLTLIKGLIVDSQKVEGQKHAKLEKADILEMTVTHLQSAKRSDEEKFMEGFEECFLETIRFLEKSKMNLSVIEKLTGHMKVFQQNLDMSTCLSRQSTSTNDGTSATEESNSKQSPSAPTTLSGTESIDSNSGTFPLNPRFIKTESSNSKGPSSTHSASSLSPSFSNDSNNNFQTEVDSLRYQRISPSLSLPENPHHHHHPESFERVLRPKLVISSPEIAPISSSENSFVLNLSTHVSSVSGFPNRSQSTRQEEEGMEMEECCEPLDFSKPLNLSKHPLGYRLSEDGVWRPW